MAAIQILFGPGKLFTAGEQGVWYDPSDFTTLFQDSAGTTPVTAVEQPVGLILDKSKGLVLGAELVTFASLTPTAEWTFGSGVWTLTNSTTNSQTLSFGGLTSGVWYRMTVTIASIGSGSLSFRHPNSSTVIPNSPTISAAGTYTVYFLASSGLIYLRNSAAGQTAVVSAFSVKELPGNHATQATSASRPILRQDANGKYYLFFDGVDDSLATAAINFTSTDKMTVFAGVRKLSDAATGYFLETSAAYDLNAGAFVLRTASGGYTTGLSSSIPTPRIGTTSGSAAPISNVVTALLDASTIVDASRLAARVDGVEKSLVYGGTAAVAPNSFGNYPLYIGRRGGSSLPFNGHLYSLIVRGAQSTDAQIVSAESYVNSKTGAY
jgi:hypothetical protein